ncbi:MAG: peptidylprolyl isomerase, partial [Bdellovibrionales bacterium]|nr:peptidylprolyl isomerase [Bdellovibrionales bacterium]
NFLFILLFSNILIGCNQYTDKTKHNKHEYKNNDFATIRTIHGNIIIKFFNEKAPNTVKRIQSLIKHEFYNGLTFHRVVPGSIIQAGKSNNINRNNKSIKAEINNLKHELGTISMAHYKNNLDSADSQFFISLKELPHLNGKYTIFGKIVNGLEILSKVRKGDKILSISLSPNYYSK